MAKLFLSAVSGSGPASTSEYRDGAYGALWLGQGRGAVDGTAIKRGEGAFLARGDRIDLGPGPQTQWIRFDLSPEPPAPEGPHRCLLTEQVDVAPGDILLRMDQVKFPPGAVAYRHVHPGAGIRVLTVGQLTLSGDGHDAVAEPGQAWFEPANAPVRAVASATHPMTSFVRFMVLPAVYAGHPTIRVLDPAEAALPRVQITQRHVDRIVQVAPG